MKETFIQILPYIQIGLSVLLIATVLLQRSEAGVGSSFGGSDNFNSAFKTRRGFEKTLFFTSIVLAFLFAVSSLVALYIK